MEARDDERKDERQRKNTAYGVLVGAIEEPALPAGYLHAASSG